VSSYIDKSPEVEQARAEYFKAKAEIYESLASGKENLSDLHPVDRDILLQKPDALAFFTKELTV